MPIPWRDQALEKKAEIAIPIVIIMINTINPTSIISFVYESRQYRLYETVAV